MLPSKSLKINVKYIMLIGFTLLNIFSSYSQKLITGIIRDAESEPIAGVSICQERNDKCVMSDPDGAFHIMIDKKHGGTLSFSFIGYKPVTIGMIDTIKNQLSITFEEEDFADFDYVDYDFPRIDPSLKRWGFKHPSR